METYMNKLKPVSEVANKFTCATTAWKAEEYITQDRTATLKAIEELMSEVRELMPVDHKNIDERISFYAACNEAESRLQALFTE